MFDTFTKKCTRNYTAAYTKYRSGSPEKSQLPSQHSKLGHYRHASETPFNGVLLEGRWWLAYSGTWILPPLINNNNKKKKINKKNVVNVGPPLTTLSGSAQVNIVCFEIIRKIPILPFHYIATNFAISIIWYLCQHMRFWCLSCMHTCLLKTSDLYLI